MWQFNVRKKASEREMLLLANGTTLKLAMVIDRYYNQAYAGAPAAS
jgi:hypothetical protein